MLASYVKSRSATFLLTMFLGLSAVAHAQSGSSTSITGTVVDPSGAVVTNATVEVRNPVSGFSRNAVTDAAGKFVVPNVPFNPYHVTVTGQGFAPYSGDVDVRSSVPGFAEELLFRGVIQARWGLFPASILFGVLHFATPAYALLATVVGLYIGLLHQFFQSLLIPIQLHALYDCAALLYLRYRVHR